ncbi:MAG: S49 family peptidase [bacterium]|nr:S49 family peptidase [bacterium]
MTFRSIVKGIVSMFAKALFALLSFFVILFLFSLLFMAIGIGVGMGVGQDGMGKLSEDGLPSYGFISGKQESENRLLSLPLQGIILGSPPANMPPSPFFSSWVTYGYALQDSLKKAAEDESVKGIFLHVQTPGGTIYGSQAIFEGIKAYREASGKPVLVYIEGLSASGGVMSMVGADAIYADYGSIIGSIGIMGPQLLYYDNPTAFDGGLLGSGIVTEGGIEQTILFAGKGKDLGNPFRRISEEELKNWQNGLNNEYDDFVQHVADNRNMSTATIEDQMGAQVFDNKSAEEFGLIDGTLNRQDSIAKLAELAELGDDFQLVRPRKESGQLLAQLLQGWYKASGQAERHEQVLQQKIQQDICTQTAHISLVYYGDISTLCR